MFDTPAKKHNREYFVHLVNIALADDVITGTEMELLHKLGKKVGMSDPEIDNIIRKTAMSDFIAPYELSKRFDQVYDVVKMILADDVIDENEMRLARGFALKSDFKASEIPPLLDLLINGIKQGKDEEDLFKEYLKEWKSRNKSL
jgi:hypothetical protein